MSHGPPFRPHFGGRPRDGHDARPEAPRRVRHGIKLRAKDAAAPRTGLALAWLDLVREAIPEEAMQDGLRYAQLGQTLFLDVRAGRLEASVQGTAAAPYTTVIALSPISEDQWERVIDIMAGEAIYAAKLLAHELPPGMDAVLESVGTGVLPSEVAQIKFQCSCGLEQPCKHAATIAHLFAESLADDPLIVLTLRGMPGERLLDRLRQARAIQMHGVAAAHADALIPEAEDIPLEECMEDYWRSAAPLDEHLREPTTPFVPHALLRRLGPSPLNGRFPLVGLLASIYDTVGAAAKHVREDDTR